MASLLITKKGQQELEAKLNYMRAVVRAEVSEEIKVARGFGDLSENAEYDAAKKRQAEVEREIAEIEFTLNNCKVVTPLKVTYCEVKNGAEGATRTYDIVGSSEADIKLNKIGFESPIGSALSNAKQGETVSVLLPNGNTKVLKLLNVVEIEG